jgi:hypothetical protein
MWTQVHRTLARVISSLFSLGLNAVFVSSASGHLGTRLDDLKKTDLFTWFHLEQTAIEEETQDQRAVTFRPEGEKFRPLTTVKVILAPDGQVSALELLLSRSFVDHSRDGVFARDIAKSFLRTIIPQEDRGATTDLTNEIEYHYPENMQVLLLTRRRPEVLLPTVPTPGYQVFLGKRQLYEQVLSRCTLKLENLQDESETLLRIAIQTLLRSTL